MYLKEHYENVIFVLRGVYRAPKGIAGFPEDGIDFILSDTVGQGSSPI
jgi:hypothetical protein